MEDGREGIRLTRIKKGILVALSMLFLSACSAGETKTTAAEPLQAASVEWVEGETGKLIKEADSLDDRIARLEAELDGAVSVEPDNESNPGDPSLVFTDVPKSYWAYFEIMSLSDQGIIKGYPELKLFFPERSITRYQAASMIIKALDLPLSTSPTVFKDVSPSHPGLREIMTVYEAGIFKGSNGSFLPNEPMKRRHMAMVLQRAFELEETSAEFTPYSDVKPNLEGYDAIKVISQLGIAQGSDGKFMPENPTKRSQFSAFIYRTLEGKY